MKAQRSRLLLLVALLGLALCSPAGGSFSGPSQAPKAAKLRVLFIGNSYTYFNDMPRLVEELAAATDPARPLEAAMVVEGGATLERHWKHGEAVAKIRAGGWDFVVLQEQSARPLTDPERMFHYVRLFDGEIRRAGGVTVLFLTWSRAYEPEMQPVLTAAYSEIAREIGARVAPVGIAWQKAATKHPAIQLYMVDRSHPSLRGSYLAACVFVAVFYGKSPVGLPTLGLDAAETRALQEAAWEAVAASPSEE